MKAKTQRLYLVVGALVALGGAGVLALSTLGDTATYFYSPSDLAAKGLPDAAIRLGGMVEQGSLVRQGQTVRFVVTDFAKTYPVTYTGILPDLFREGQGVIAEGRIDRAAGVFHAETILAKHDEKYMPPEVTKSLKAAKPAVGQVL
ncbi:cytochrome C biogenesis protein CcmE [alpha proteobacterium AAP81b]|nr:cytochrome C biogenesis protein CcmE [alpha proteobacterium AAP81b]